MRSLPLIIAALALSGCQAPLNWIHQRPDHPAPIDAGSGAQPTIFIEQPDGSYLSYPADQCPAER